MKESVWVDNFYHIDIASGVKVETRDLGQLLSMQQRLQWFYEHTIKAAAQHNIDIKEEQHIDSNNLGRFAFPAGSACW
jgi:hypothetical protein